MAAGESESVLSAFQLEVARLFFALSAWESVPSGPVAWPDLRDGVSASSRE
jgi:hypothetical protein